MEWASTIDLPTLLTALIGAVIGGLFTLAGVAWEQRVAYKRSEAQLRKQWLAQEAAEVIRLLSAYDVRDYWTRARRPPVHGQERGLPSRAEIETHFHRLKVWMDDPAGLQSRVDRALDALEKTWMPPGMEKPPEGGALRDTADYPEEVHLIHEAYQRRLDAAISSMPHVTERQFLEAMDLAEQRFCCEFEDLGRSFGFTRPDDHHGQARS